MKQMKWKNLSLNCSVFFQTTEFFGNESNKKNQLIQTWICVSLCFLFLFYLEGRRHIFTRETLNTLSATQLLSVFTAVTSRWRHRTCINPTFHSLVLLYTDCTVARTYLCLYQHAKQHYDIILRISNLISGGLGIFEVLRGKKDVL